MSKKTAIYKAKLVDECYKAMRVAVSLKDPELAGRWERRVNAINTGRVTEVRAVKWLEGVADYWQPKDREYANYIRQLIKGG